MHIPIAIVVWAVTLTLVLLFAPRTDQKRIDCEQVEFHPDYSPKIKEKCRDRIKV
jgi:hypothetical protein